MIGKIFLTGVFLLMASVAGAEYYQYTDETGNLRFTDDLTQIPESRQGTVEKFASESSPMMGMPSNQPSEPREAQERNTSADPTESYAGPGGGEFGERAAELNKMQAELAKTRQALEKEQAKIEAQAPGEDATTNDRIAYSVKVEALNAKIDRYGKDLKAFEEKVEAFNNRGKAQTE